MCPWPVQVADVEAGHRPYSEAVAQLEELLQLEREGLALKRKVAAFTIDYDDDLVNRSASTLHNDSIYVN